MARRRAGVLLAVLLAYDGLVRPRMRSWGSTPQERAMHLPGDDVVEEVMAHDTKGITIEAPPGAVWPWLVQMGDRRGGFYSYDWIERFVFGGTVHYVEGTRSATRVHPELQDVGVGDRIDTGSVGHLRIGRPVTVIEPGRALVVGTWAFVLRPLPGDRTRLLVRERDAGYLRPLVPRRFALARAVAAVVDDVVGEPLHFAMGRKMMLGLKERGERRPRPTPSS
ncbi:hypothetical protein [Georgenia thermotolerans]|uniref:SRPBCC family protein n=1 Tax=Georgenia thermotolerans TaxID=527326 RepID=A0A7J5UK07_9MICO|nr:hypothetical protein [Georgenia thermotolerans]KAE8762712.1 hypothetical protein GB883_17930 [Georgenia thermotolerans]